MGYNLPFHFENSTFSNNSAGEPASAWARQTKFIEDLIERLSPVQMPELVAGLHQRPTLRRSPTVKGLTAALKAVLSAQH